MANHKLVFRVPPGTEGEQWLKQMGKYLNKESYSVRRKLLVLDHRVHLN